MSSNLPNIQSKEKLQQNSALKPESSGSPNKLNVPNIDDEPNQPLFGKTELTKSEFAKSGSDRASLGLETESAMFHAAMKLKDQNNKLRNQLKDLKDTLKETLFKVQMKQRQSLQEKSLESGENILAKELDETQKQLSQYRKEVQALKNRLSSFHNQDKVVNLENSLKDKNRQIDELSKEKRNLEKIKATQDNQLDSFQKEFGYEKRIKAFNEESRELREKIRKMINVNRANEKTFKQQQEYLVALSNQYRIICDKLGIAPSLNFTKAEELNNIITKKVKEAKERQAEVALYRNPAGGNPRVKAKGERSKSVKENREINRLEPTPENINKVQANIEMLQAKVETASREYAREISAAQAQKQEGLTRLKELESKLRDREKESSILNHRISELRRMVRFNALRPLNQGEDTIKEKVLTQGVVSPGSSQSGRSQDPPLKSNLLRNLKNHANKG